MKISLVMEKIAPILLGIMTYIMAYNKLIIYGKDHQVKLLKEYIVNKVFVYPDYLSYQYLEGGSAFDLIPPFLFYLMVMMLGARFFFSVNKNFFQFCGIRVTNIRQLIVIMQKKAIPKMLICSASYHITIIFLIMFGNKWQLETSYQQMIFPIFLLFLSNSLFLIGLWKILFYSYLRQTILSFVLYTASALSFLIMINNVYPTISFFFLWSGGFWYLRGFIGSFLVVLSLIIDRKVKFTL